MVRHYCGVFIMCIGLESSDIMDYVYMCVHRLLSICVDDWKKKWLSLRTYVRAT